MRLSTGSFRKSMLKGLTAALISIPVTRFALDWYAAITISLGHGGVIDTMIRGAMVVTAVLVFITVFISNYLELDNSI